MGQWKGALEDMVVAQPGARGTDSVADLIEANNHLIYSILRHALIVCRALRPGEFCDEAAIGGCKYRGGAAFMLYS